MSYAEEIPVYSTGEHAYVVDLDIFIGTTRDSAGAKSVANERLGHVSGARDLVNRLIGGVVQQEFLGHITHLVGGDEGS
jgi:hypothetical protein